MLRILSCISDSDSLRKLRHTGLPQLTHINISQLYRRVNSILWVHAYTLHTPIHVCMAITCPMPHTNFILATGTLLFHSGGTYVSLFLPHPVAPWTPRTQQAAGLTGCRTPWDGMDDNLCPPRGSARDRKIDRKAEWRNREKKKETRAHRSEL